MDRSLYIDDVLQIEDDYSFYQNKVFTWFKTFNLEPNVINFKKYLNRIHNSPGTKYHLTAGFKHRLKYIYKLNPEVTTMDNYRLKLELDQLPKIKRKKGIVKKADILTLDEQVFLCHMTGKRTSLMIKFLLYTGVRVTEMLNVRLTDITWDDNSSTIHVREGKGNKERETFCNTEVLNEIIEIFKPENYLFISSNKKVYSRHQIYNYLNRASKCHLGRKLGPHLVRHSFATCYLEKYPGDYKRLQEILGHSNIDILINFYDHQEIEAKRIENLYAPQKNIDITTLENRFRPKRGGASQC